MANKRRIRGVPMIFNPSPALHKIRQLVQLFRRHPIPSRPSRHAPWPDQDLSVLIFPALICPVTISPVKTCPIQSSSSIRQSRKPPPCPIRPVRTRGESARVLVAASRGSTAQFIWAPARCPSLHLLPRPSTRQRSPRCLRKSVEASWPSKMKLASWPGFKVPISFSARGSRAHFLSTR